MVNNTDWKRRSDEWVRMLEQSRLRKEKCASDKKSNHRLQAPKKIEAAIRKPTDASSLVF